MIRKKKSPKHQTTDFCFRKVAVVSAIVEVPMEAQCVTSGPHSIKPRMRNGLVLAVNVGPRHDEPSPRPPRFLALNSLGSYQISGDVVSRMVKTVSIQCIFFPRLSGWSNSCSGFSQSFLIPVAPKEMTRFPIAALRIFSGTCGGMKFFVIFPLRMGFFENAPCSSRKATSPKQIVEHSPSSLLPCF